MASSSTAADALTGRLVGGRWRILSLLDDSGGMASVYLADDERLPRKAVVKIPKAAQFNAEFAERFAREAFWHAKVENLHVVHILDRGEEEGTPFLVLQYLAGGNLKAWCERNASILDDPRLHYESWLLPVALALDAVASQGIVHRDVKPSNILFDAAGQAYLTDFGIVKVGSDATMTGTGLLVGTLQFMSPEQCHEEKRHALDGRSDQYGLAVTAYQVMTDWKYPVVDDTAVIYAAKFGMSPMKQPRDHAPRVPQAVNRAVMRALSPDRRKRFPSSLDFADAILAGFGRAARSPRKTPSRTSSTGPENRLQQPERVSDELVVAKRPLEVAVAGWWVTASSLITLIGSVLQVYSPGFEAALVSSPLPAPLPHVILFGGTILGTICGIGMLYGESVARLAYCFFNVICLVVAFAVTLNLALVVLSMLPIAICMSLLFSPRANRYFSQQPPVDPSSGDAPPFTRFVQVVGRPCASCEQRISDATTASPCSGCGRPLHRECAADKKQHLCETCATDAASKPA